MLGGKGQTVELFYRDAQVAISTSGWALIWSHLGDLESVPMRTVQKLY